MSKFAANVTYARIYQGKAITLEDFVYYIPVCHWPQFYLLTLLFPLPPARLKWNLTNSAGPPGHRT